MTASARSGPRRTADVLAKLAAVGADTWVATASAAGVGHLVPLSYAWDGECIVLAAQADSLTMRNLEASGRARLGFGPTRDVVIIDTELDRVVPTDDAEAAAIVSAYAEQAGWDPREEPEAYVLAILRPRRVQAWREANELQGRLLMADGRWLFEAES